MGVLLILADRKINIVNYRVKPFPPLKLHRVLHIRNSPNASFSQSLSMSRHSRNANLRWFSIPARQIVIARPDPVQVNTLAAERALADPVHIPPPNKHVPNSTSSLRSQINSHIMRFHPNPALDTFIGECETQSIVDHKNVLIILLIIDFYSFIPLSLTNVSLLVYSSLLASVKYYFYKTH